MSRSDFDLADPRVAALFNLSPQGEWAGERQAAGEALTSGIESLAMCRESGEDPQLLAGLIDQTLKHFADQLPGSELLRELGYRAYADPDALPSSIDWAWVRFGRARALLLRHESVLYLYAMTSAAKSNHDGRNDFSELFCRIVEASRPGNIVVSSFSRLVRSLEHSPRLQDAIQRNCRQVHTMQQSIDIGSPVGQLLWSVFAMLAAGERDAINQRLFNGRVSKWRRGEWPFGNSRSVPLGYKLVDKKLVVDPEQRQVLTDVFELLADSSLSEADVAFRLRAMGINQVRDKASSRRPSPRLDGMKSPPMIVARLLRWVDVYLTGEYRLAVTNPYVGVTEILGHPVETITDETGAARSVIYLTFDVGRPDLDPDLIQRAVSVRVGGKGVAAPDAAPLTARTWTSGDHTMWLAGQFRGKYVIARRMGLEPGVPRIHASGIINGQQVASVKSEELHASILRSIADGLEEGVFAERLGLSHRVAALTGSTWVDRLSAQREALEQRRLRLTREIEGAVRASTRTDDMANIEDLLSRASRLRLERERVVGDIAEIDRRRTEAQVPALVDFETDAQFILEALSVIGPAGDVISGQARAALSQVLTDFSMDVSDGALRWRAFLVLPCDDYEVRVGPFEGSVERRGRVLPEAAVSDPLVNAEIGDKYAEFEAALRAADLPALAAKCAARAPMGLLPRVLLGESVVWPGCDEAFDHDEFSNYLREVWSDPAWSGRQYLRTHAPRQLLTDLVASAGGRADLARVLRDGESSGLKYQQVHYMTRGSNDVNDVARPWCPPVLREGDWSPGSSQSEHFLLSRRCWSCGEPATAVVRVLEVAGDLMCRQCSAAIDLPGRVFPRLYLDMALRSTF